MLLCRGVPLLNRDLEGSDAGGLRELGVDWEEGVVGLLEAKVTHPRDLSHSETAKKPHYGQTVLNDQHSTTIFGNLIEAGLRMGKQFFGMESLIHWIIQTHHFQMK